MRICLISSSITPGRDGVADYLWQLSKALRRNGHETCLIGLADKHCADEALSASDTPCLQFGPNDPWSRRTDQARAFIEAFAPEWISLQYVPYAWHPKGYAGGIIQPLSELLAGYRIQLMIHELWVGLARGDSLANRIHGLIQRRALLRLRKDLRPEVVSTTNPTYASVLRSYGWDVFELPLFSNIPIHPLGTVRPQDWLREHCGGIALPAREEGLIAGWFGSIHPQWDGLGTVQSLLKCARALDKQLILISLGRTGAHGEALLKSLRGLQAEGLVLLEMGAQSEEAISHWMQCMDLALTANPMALVGKSGSVAAFLEHGVPVLVTRDDWVPRLAQGSSSRAEQHPRVLAWDIREPLDIDSVVNLKQVPEATSDSVAQSLVEKLS